MRIHSVRTLALLVVLLALGCSEDSGAPTPSGDPRKSAPKQDSIQEEKPPEEIDPEGEAVASPTTDSDADIETSREQGNGREEHPDATGDAKADGGSESQLFRRYQDALAEKNLPLARQCLGQCVKSEPGNPILLYHYARLVKDIQPVSQEAYILFHKALPGLKEPELGQCRQMIAEIESLAKQAEIALLTPDEWAKHLARNYPNPEDLARVDVETDFLCTGLNRNGYLEYCHLPTDMIFILIPSGSFQMGSLPRTRYGNPDETPLHQVWLDAYLISKYELTQKIWQQVMGETPWKDKKYAQDDPQAPATYITWEDCQRFCLKTGLSLPSEAQWERACRANTSTVNYWGDDMDSISKYAWYHNANSTGYPQRVGQKKPNGFGLYDMIGNAYECCRDWYGEDYYGETLESNPKGPAEGAYRVYRGGSWSSDARFCRSAARFSAPPDYRSGFGVRMAKSLPK